PLIPPAALIMPNAVSMPSFIWRPSSLAEPLNGAAIPKRISVSVTPRTAGVGRGCGLTAASVGAGALASILPGATLPSLGRAAGITWVESVDANLGGAGAGAGLEPKFSLPE